MASLRLGPFKGNEYSPRKSPPGRIPDLTDFPFLFVRRAFAFIRFICCCEGCSFCRSLEGWRVAKNNPGLLITPRSLPPRQSNVHQELWPGLFPPAVILDKHRTVNHPPRSSDPEEQSLRGSDRVVRRNRWRKCVRIIYECRFRNKN